jgi:hypothetical protein
VPQLSADPLARTSLMHAKSNIVAIILVVAIVFVPSTKSLIVQ